MCGCDFQVWLVCKHGAHHASTGQIMTCTPGPGSDFLGKKEDCYMLLCPRGSSQSVCLQIAVECHFGVISHVHWQLSRAWSNLACLHIDEYCWLKLLWPNRPKLLHPVPPHHQRPSKPSPPKHTPFPSPPAPSPCIIKECEFACNIQADRISFDEPER